MSNVLKLNFAREAHVKKYKKLMKLDLPAELERLRYVCVSDRLSDHFYLFIYFSNE